MHENHDQIPAAADAEAAGTESTEHPAGEMMLSRRSKVGARARALAGFALTVGISVVIAAGPDTTIKPGIS